jgi:quercetin dioxygenase-like cupin family protein
MARAEHKQMNKPDETRKFEKGRMEVVKVNRGSVGRLTFEPGWRWSTHMKAGAGTKSCKAPHFQYHTSGQLAIKMDDGTKLVAKPGDIASLPSGHDALVIGNDPVVVVDWHGATNDATKK